MDPRTESGTNELLGIYLEQNAANHVPPAERELQRGLMQSPEKASKSKSAKFVRCVLSAFWIAALLWLLRLYSEIVRVHLLTAMCTAGAGWRSVRSG